MNQKLEVKEFDWQGKKLKFSTGDLAFFADSEIRVDFGETTILVTVAVSPEPREEVDFLPLLVNYEEKFYASGKISGSRFIKREGRPSEQAVLNARLIDRPIRPLFPKNYKNDVQIVATVLSYDPECPPEVPSILAASLALCLSSAPFQGPIGAVRVGLKNNEFILNPTDGIDEDLDLDFIVVGNKEKILMIEGRAKEIPEDKVIEAITWAHQQLLFSLEIQKDFLKDAKEEETEYLISESDIHIKVSDLLGSELKKALAIKDAEKRDLHLSEFEGRALKELEGNYKQIEIKNALNELIKKETRELILEKGQRPDGRKEDEIRPIGVQVGVLPRTHGSGIFVRGQTQVLSVTTLDSPAKEQLVDTMEEEGIKRFMHHYNFPPFSSGEVKPLTSPSRREIGHGALVEKSLHYIIPSKKDFPYTIRVVSEVLSSNGSTSMASVCAATLSLMDAGVPIKNPVAGIAMGLVAEEKNGKIVKKRILTDIQGIEDFAGDMDFKVAGTNVGVTAVQMDVKIKGIDFDVIREVFEKAKIARVKILGEMQKVLAKPKSKVSPLAPAIEIVTINPDRIGDVIGPGGKTIREIIAQTETEIDVEPDGSVYISSKAGNHQGVKEATELIKNLTREVKIGEVFNTRVVKVVDFGVFVEIFPGQEGLIHISELSDKRIEDIHHLVKVGDVIPAKLIRIDDQGRLALSVKVLSRDQKKGLKFT